MKKINILKDRFLADGFSKNYCVGKSQKSQKSQKSKILLKIYLEEEKRERQIEDIWCSLTEEDLLYMDNMELFNL